jgi:hypothetical protein
MADLTNRNETELAELKMQAQTITSTFEREMIATDPSNSVLYLNANQGGKTATDLRSSIHPFKMPTSVKKKAEFEANKYLGNNTDTPLDIKQFGAFESLNKSERDFEIERERRAERREIDFISKQRNASPGVSEGDQNRLVNTLGIPVGSGAGEIVRQCIPCGIRPMSLKDIEFSNPFVQTLEDMKNKLKDLERMLESLKFGDAFEQDFCDLLSALDSQCLPDLFGMISLFGILQLKYTEGLDFSLNSALNSILAPFLSPIIGPFVTNLEKYVNMIVDPMTCVVNSLEQEMFKLDVVGAVNNVQAQQESFNRRKIEFYRSKVSALTRRKSEINEDRKLIKKDGKSSNTTVDTFPRYPSTLPFTGGAQIENSDALNSLDETLREQGVTKGSIRQSYEEELAQIEKDIDNNKIKIVGLEDTNAQFTKKDNKAFEKVATFADESREKLDEAKESLRSIFKQLTKGMNQGIQVVRDNLEMYRVELERTITDRIQTQQDQIELARSIQTIQRYVSIVNAVVNLKSTGDLFDKCNGSSSDALGGFVSAFKQEPSGGNYNFYKGTDAEGQELMVIAPGGTTVNVTSVEFEDVGSDELLREASLNEVQNTATYGDLNEADKLNRKGVLLDLGNLDNKEITLKSNDADGNKTELDYKAQHSYVIIKNNFCNKAALNFGSSDTVRKWTEQL